jgi:hypothetical protein
MAERKDKRRPSIQVSLSASQLTALDAWIKRCPAPKPSRAEAICCLLDQAIPKGLGLLYDNLTLDEARTLPHGASFTIDGTIYVDTDPRRQRFVLWMLEGIEKCGGCGGGLELLETICECGAHGLPLPPWVVKDLHHRLQKVMTFETGSWDHAFGRPFPKRASLSKLKRDSKLRPLVHRCVTKILNDEPATPIDVALFERVAAEFQIGKTLCIELFYAEQREHRACAPLDKLGESETEAADLYAAVFKLQRDYENQVRRATRGQNSRFRTNSA